MRISVRARQLAVVAVAILWSTFAPPATAGVFYSTAGSTYSQNFDTLNADNDTVTMQGWTNDSTIAGWSLFRQPSPGTPVTFYRSSSGDSTTGSFYSFGVLGVNSNSDRALGGIGSGGTYFGAPASGDVAGWMAVNFHNVTGSTMTSFNLSYDGEQWRNASNNFPQPNMTMVLEYGFGSSFAAVGSWTAPGSSFNFTDPINDNTMATALDGNDSANRVAGIGGTITGLNWADGTDLWIRFVERNDVGNDHGLALDNFQFKAFASVNAVPEPMSATLAVIGAAGVGLFSRRQRRNG